MPRGVFRWTRAVPLLWLLVLSVLSRVPAEAQTVSAGARLSAWDSGSFTLTATSGDPGGGGGWWPATPFSEPLIRLSGPMTTISLYSGPLLSLTTPQGIECGAGAPLCLAALGRAEPGATLPRFEIFPPQEPLANVVLTTDRPDLAGIWRFHALTASATQGITGRWFTGSVTIGANGTTTGDLLESGGRRVLVNGAAFPGGPSYWLVSGIEQATSGPLGFNAFMDAVEVPGARAVVGAGAFLDGFLRFHPAYVTLVKQRGTAFAQGELAGEWQAYGVTTPETPGAQGAPLEGALTIDGGGAPTGNLRVSDRLVPVTGGALAVSSAGAVSGAIDWTSGTATIEATFAAPGLVLGVIDARGATGGSGRDLGLVTLVRPMPGAVTAGDLAGSWRVHGLSVLADQGNLGTSLAGTVTIDESGTITWGTLMDVTGASWPVAGGQVAVSGHRVTGHFLTPPALGRVELSASVVSSGLIAGRSTIQTSDGSGALLTAHGFLTLVRDVGRPVPAITPWVLDFGSVAVDTVRALALTVTNDGVGTLTGSVVARGSGYRVVSGSPFSLEPGERQEVVVAFEPITGGSSSGQFVLTAGGEAALGSLVGTGVSPWQLSVGRVGSGTGTIRSDPGGIDCGERCRESFSRGAVVTLRAQARPGSVFAGWSGACRGRAACRVTIDVPRSVIARFNPARPGTLTIRRSGPGTGTVSSAPAGIRCGSDCLGRYPAGTTVTLTAAPASGSTFIGWRGVCNGTGSCTVTIAGAQSVVAAFGRPPRPHP